MNVILIAVISLEAMRWLRRLFFTWLPRNLPCMKIRELHNVAAVLPQANCGGCGYPGCSGFAELASRQVRWKVNFVRWADDLS